MAAKPVPGSVEAAEQATGLLTKEELEAASVRALDLADVLGFLCARFADASESWPDGEAQPTAENVADVLYLVEGIRMAREQIEEAQAFMLEVAHLLNIGRKSPDGGVGSIANWPPTVSELARIGVTRPAVW